MYIITVIFLLTDVIANGRVDAAAMRKDILQ